MRIRILSAAAVAAALALVPATADAAQKPRHCGTITSPTEFEITAYGVRCKTAMKVAEQVISKSQFGKRRFVVRVNGKLWKAHNPMDSHTATARRGRAHILLEY
jgi:hypothetical protein